LLYFCAAVFTARIVEIRRLQRASPLFFFKQHKLTYFVPETLEAARPTGQLLKVCGKGLNFKSPFSGILNEAYEEL
jgi:hypothetical protein